MIKRRRAFNFILLAFILIGPAAGVVSAQDKAVKRIKQLYQEIGSKIDLSEKGIEESQYAGIFCNELVVNRNKHVWPVVGNNEVSYKFYYELAHTEGHEYPDRLRKVIMNSSMSDRSYSSEYLFDETGALVFYLNKPNEPHIDGEPDVEQLRIYFENGRPVRIIKAQVPSDSLNSKDRALAREVVNTSGQIKLFFAKSILLPTEK